MTTSFQIWSEDASERERKTESKESFIIKTSKSFFATAVKYLQAQGKHTHNVKYLHCLLVKSQPQHEGIQKAAATLQEKCPNVTINEDALLTRFVACKSS